MTKYLAASIWKAQLCLSGTDFSLSHGFSSPQAPLIAPGIPVSRLFSETFIKIRMWFSKCWRQGDYYQPEWHRRWSENNEAMQCLPLMLKYNPSYWYTFLALGLELPWWSKDRAVFPLIRQSWLKKVFSQTLNVHQVVSTRQILMDSCVCGSPSYADEVVHGLGVKS